MPIFTAMTRNHGNGQKSQHTAKITVITAIINSWFSYSPTNHLNENRCPPSPNINRSTNAKTKTDTVRRPLWSRRFHPWCFPSYRPPSLTLCRCRDPVPLHAAISLRFTSNFIAIRSNQSTALATTMSWHSGLCVCPSVTWVIGVSQAKTAESIEVPFLRGRQIHVGSRNYVLDGGT